MLDYTLANRLKQHKAAGLMRTRHLLSSPQSVNIQIQNKSFINFSSNDYLSLSNHPRVTEALKNGIKSYGLGSGAASLVSGYRDIHADLEEDLAAFTGRPRALVFSNGHLANLGVIKALLQKGDGAFVDRLAHASLIDGALHSAAEVHRFKHNDVKHLQYCLNNTEYQQRLIITEGIFSMDGDQADFTGLLTCMKNDNGKKKAALYLDDAHGFGVLGKKGAGSVEAFNLSVDDVPILMATFGKACGTFGAFIAGSDVLIEYLLQFTRTGIFTTALPPAIAFATREALHILSEEAERRENLMKNISYFKHSASELGLHCLPSNTPIQALVLNDPERAVAIGNALYQQGILVGVMRPPTVPQNTSCLRITLNTEHKHSHIDQLLECLANKLSNESKQCYVA